MSLADRSAGLEGVVAGRSSITWVGGETSNLVYRGYDARALATGVPYESVAHLLLLGEPPSADPSPELARSLRGAREVPPPTVTAADALAPGLPPLEALRTILSLLGDGSWGYPPKLEEGYRLIAQAPVLLARHVRRANGREPLAPRGDLGHVANYLWMLTGEEPTAARVRALEAYFDLLADHGMNASTFVLRIAISTHSDLASAATAALATLKGPLHGGAPSRVVEMLDGVGAPEERGALGPRAPRPPRAPLRVRPPGCTSQRTRGASRSTRSPSASPRRSGYASPKRWNGPASPRSAPRTPGPGSSPTSSSTARSSSKRSGCRPSCSPRRSPSRGRLAGRRTRSSRRATTG